MGEFADAAFRVVRQIPRGTVATYGLVARLMGRPQSARYVGFALRAKPSDNTSKDDIPCYRVVFSDGRICEGDQFGGPAVQRKLLQDEGVVFVDDMHVDLAQCLWDGRGANDGRARPRVESGGDEGLRGVGANEGLPTAPPADFDWAAELGE